MFDLLARPFSSTQTSNRERNPQNMHYNTHLKYPMLTPKHQNTPLNTPQCIQLQKKTPLTTEQDQLAKAIIVDASGQENPQFNSQAQVLLC